MPCQCGTFLSRWRSGLVRNSEINVSAKHIIDINAMKQLCSLRPTLVKIFYLLLFLFLRMMSLSFTLFLFMRMISLSLAIFHAHQFLFIFVVCNCVLPFSAVCLSFHILIFLCMNVSIFNVLFYSSSIWAYSPASACLRVTAFFVLFI